jgi:hypothetical protein
VALLIFIVFATSCSSAEYSKIKETTDLTGDFILFNGNEIQLFIEMHFPQCRFLDHPMIQFSLDLHHEQEHVIVRFARKEDFTSVQLIKRTTD